MPGRSRPKNGEIAGLSIGSAEGAGGTSGVTALLFDEVAPTVVDVRGGASGTYDTASLSLDATFGARHGLFLSGGSLYGLDAAIGLREEILRRGGGVRAFENPNPVVPISGAILFDLPRRKVRPPDYAAIGARAARKARPGTPAIGRVGAGAGATVGKYLGRGRAAEGGLGFAASRVEPDGSIAALVAVNSVGAVRDPSDGGWIAGPVDRSGRIVPPPTSTAPNPPLDRGRGTTLACIVTDLRLPRPMLQRVAVYVHDGLARAIHPAHTATDGDVVFVTSTQRRPDRASDRYPGERADQVGRRAAELVVSAVLSAVTRPSS